MKKMYVIFLIFNIASISMMTSTITAFHQNVVKEDLSPCVKEQSNNSFDHILNISKLEENTFFEILPVEHLRDVCFFRYIGLEQFEKMRAQKNKYIYDN